MGGKIKYRPLPTPDSYLQGRRQSVQDGWQGLKKIKIKISERVIAFLVKQIFFLRRTLTRTRLDTGRSKVKLPVWVGLGLKRDGVIGGGQWTVLFTYTAVVEVTTSLQRGGNMFLQ